MKQMKKLVFIFLFFSMASAVLVWALPDECTIIGNGMAHAQSYFEYEIYRDLWFDFGCHLPD
jgi:hypothetical protein